MAGNYQNVSTPRFWVSSLQWLESLNMIAMSSTDNTKLSHSSGHNGKSYTKLAYINPIEATLFKGGNGQGFSINFDIIEPFVAGENPVNWSDIIPENNSFFMLLGHNFGGNVFFRVTHETSNDALAHVPYLNYSLSQSSNNMLSPYQGFSIGIGNNAHNNSYNRIKLYFNQGYSTSMDKYFSSFLYGTFFNLQAPDLNLTLTREYGEVKTLQSKTGYTYSNSFITKQPNWGNGLPSWHLYKQSNATAPAIDELAPLAINGRRVWDLKFSYLDEQNIFSKVSSVTDYITGSSNNIDYLGGALLQENTFYSQVLLRTQGLPFVFQPDSNNSNPDQFAICMFDQNSFQFKRTSLNTYDVSLKIREVW